MLEERHLKRTGYSHQLRIRAGSIVDNNRRYIVRQAKLLPARRWIRGVSSVVFENDIDRIPTANNDRRILYERAFAFSLTAFFLRC